MEALRLRAAFDIEAGAIPQRWPSTSTCLLLTPCPVPHVAQRGTEPKARHHLRTSFNPAQNEGACHGVEVAAGCGLLYCFSSFSPSTTQPPRSEPELHPTSIKVPSILLALLPDQPLDDLVDVGLPSSADRNDHPWVVADVI